VGALGVLEGDRGPGGGQGPAGLGLAASSDLEQLPVPGGAARELERGCDKGMERWDKG